MADASNVLADRFLDGLVGMAAELAEVLSWPATRAGPALVGSLLRVGEVAGFVLSTRTSPEGHAKPGHLWTPVVDSGHGLAVGCASGGAVIFLVVAFDAVAVTLSASVSAASTGATTSAVKEELPLHSAFWTVSDWEASSIQQARLE
jgi:hypothetical protein